MKLLYIGSGYVGTASAAVSADSGHRVLVYDIDKKKIEKFSSFKKEEIESCLFEEGLVELLERNKDRLKFTAEKSEVGEFLNSADAVFMCLPTPEKDSSGETNMSYYESAANDLAELMAARNGGGQKGYILVVNKSTVPIKTSGRAREIMERKGVYNFGIGSNPEFLVEGKAVEGSIRPQRVVVGAWNEKDLSIFRDIYKRFYDSPKTEYIEVNPVEAETGKLLANYLLFNRLAACFDVVGRVCEKFDNLHFENIRNILISDSRIGSWGFYDSLYAGGSCFIKDSRSLSFQLKEAGADADMVDNVLAANERQISSFMERPEKDLLFDWTDKRVALIGLAFKRDTDDVRNSGSLKAAEYLFDKKIKSLEVFDPIAVNNFIKYFDDHAQKNKINKNSSESDAIKNSDVIIIAADWPQFRELAEAIKSDFKGKLIMDGRRMLQHKYEELREAGFKIIAVGEK
jgi:UDPglucose 6-dehydrogenase